MYGKTFYYNYRFWKVVNYDDVSGLYICRALNSQDYQYFGEEIIKSAWQRARSVLYLIYQKKGIDTDENYETVWEGTVPH